MRSGAWRGSLLAALAAASACAGEEGPALRLGLRDPLASLDPHTVDDRPTFQLLANVYEPLAVNDAGGALVPALATAWSNPDERTWRFELRQGVRFQDGRRLSARDVRYTLERALTHPRSWMREDLSGVTSVRDAGDHTVEVATQGPSPLLLQSLTRILVVPEGWAEVGAGANGTGPYRIESWQPERTSLRANPQHWRGRPRWASVSARALPDPKSRLDALLSGDVDLIDFPPEPSIPFLRAAPRTQVIETPAAHVAILGFHVAGGPGKPFADPRLREAVALSLDREALVRDVLGGRGAPTGQFAPSGVFGFVPGLAVPRPDPAGARAALLASRFPGGAQAELLCAAAGQPLAEAVAGQVRASGVELAVSPVPWPEFDRRLAAREAAAFVFHISHPELDSTRLLSTFFHSVQADRRRGTMNFSAHADPELDALLELAETEFDSQTRYSLLARATRHVLGARVWLPLYTQRVTYAARRGLHWDGGLVPGTVFERIRSE
jgi:peptide/nickel transport system substrate-binding protein